MKLLLVLSLLLWLQAASIDAQGIVFPGSNGNDDGESNEEQPDTPEVRAQEAQTEADNNSGKNNTRVLLRRCASYLHCFKCILSVSLLRSYFSKKVSNKEKYLNDIIKTPQYFYEVLKEVYTIGVIIN